MTSGIVDNIMQAIEDVMVDAEVDFPAGTEAGPRIQYHDTAIRERVETILSAPYITDQMVECAAKELERIKCAPYNWDDQMFDEWWNNAPRFVEHKRVWAEFQGTAKQYRLWEARIILEAGLKMETAEVSKPVAWTSVEEFERLQKTFVSGRYQLAPGEGPSRHLREFAVPLYAAPLATPSTDKRTAVEPVAWVCEADLAVLQRGYGANLSVSPRFRSGSRTFPLYAAPHPEDFTADVWQQHKELIEEAGKLREQNELLRQSAQHSSEVASNAIADMQALQEELEQERMRLAACGVIAVSNTKTSAERERNMHADYWSASAGDVAAAVDREMKYREQVAENARTASMITPSNIAYQRQIGDLTDWCDRIRAALTREGK